MFRLPETRNGICLRCWEFHVAHLNTQRKRSLLWKQKNRDQVRRDQRIWKLAHRGTDTANTRKRAAAKLQATPPWVEVNDLKVVYDLAAKKTAEGVPHHVDHIYPLRGREFCGLHVPWNLRAIPADENRRKGIRVTPEMLAPVVGGKRVFQMAR